MDCPICGVYNPEERTVCWRCDRELPKPKPPRKKGMDASQATRRMWLGLIIILLIWMVLFFVLPMIVGGTLFAP